jgi:hypothetical protein
VYGSEGAGYYHIFNVTLWGDERAVCTDTNLAEFVLDADMSAVSGIDVLSKTYLQSLQSWICRATALSTMNKNGTKSMIYVTPIA